MENVKLAIEVITLVGESRFVCEGLGSRFGAATNELAFLQCVRKLTLKWTPLSVVG